MLSLMRDKAQSWIIKILFAIIIIVFVGFYGFSGNKNTVKEPVVTVGEKKISMKEFQEAYKNMLQFYTNIYKNQISDEMIEQLGLKQQVLDQLINKEVLIQQAKKLNIRVSKEDVRKVATKLLDNISRPLLVENHSIEITASIGINIADNQNLPYVELLKNSDSAMYQVKENGKNDFRFFETEFES